MDEYRVLLGKLATIESSLYGQLKILFIDIMFRLRDLSETQGHIQLVASVPVFINELKLRARDIIDSHTEQVVNAANEYLNAQEVDSALFIGERVQRFVSNALQWVDLLSIALIQEFNKTEVDLNRAVFSKRLTQDGASVFRKTDNSIGLNTQFAIFALVNGIVIDGYRRQQDQEGAKFKKMAIAVIDDRTTDTCKRIHRNIVSVDGKFTLTARPRFARQMDMPPFHWHCRTSTLLIKSREQQEAIESLLQRS